MNLKLAKSMPLFVDLSKVTAFDSQGLRLLLEVLSRVQERCTYLKFIDHSENIMAALQNLGAERILHRLLLDYPYEPVCSTE